MAKATKSKKRKLAVPADGNVHVTATFNNTIITVTDKNGSVLTWGSAGTSGFKGTRKSTPFAATSSVQTVADKVFEAGMRRVDIYIKGIGMGRDAAIRAIKAAGLEIKSIADISPMPHNGCRPRKRRRV